MSKDRVNLSAYTTPYNNPAYISINYYRDSPTVKLEITIRSEGKDDGTLGNTAVIRMDYFYFKKLVQEALEKGDHYNYLDCII